jgi:hypothetical protein
MKELEIGLHPIFGMSLGFEYVPDTEDQENESALAIDLLIVRILFLWRVKD